MSSDFGRDIIVFNLFPELKNLKKKKEILEHGLHIELPREDDMLTLCTSNLKAM
jgi:hypothetical protein